MDTLLLFLAGMIFGGYIYVRVESFAMGKYYPDVNDEARMDALKRVGFVLTFIGVFCFVLVFFLLKNAVLAGVCAGFAIFGLKP
jgi:hypothetical protein